MSSRLEDSKFDENRYFYQCNKTVQILSLFPARNIICLIPTLICQNSFLSMLDLYYLRKKIRFPHRNDRYPNLWKYIISIPLPILPHKERK